MNSIQLTKALTGMKCKTRGVFPADRIPRVWNKPAAIIANTDDHTKPGAHWVAIYASKNGDGVYFDSYGRPPHLQQYTNRLRINCKRFEWNQQPMQSFSSAVCGQYCIMFLHYMCRGMSLKKFCKMFTDNRKKNDKIVSKFYKKFEKKKRKNSNNFKTYYGKGCTRIKYLQHCVPAFAPR